MICYVCQGTGVSPERPDWPCPLCYGQRHVHCCEGDAEQPDPPSDRAANADPPAAPDPPPKPPGT